MTTRFSALTLRYGQWAGWSTVNGVMPSFEKVVDVIKNDPEYGHIIIDADNEKAWVSHEKHIERVILSAKKNFKIDLKPENISEGFPDL